MGSKTTTTAESKPPTWAQPLFTQSAKDAGALYNSGSGGNTYLGSTVAPFSDLSMYGINNLAQTGGQVQDIYGEIGAQSVDNPTVRGDYLAEGNPYYRDRLEKEATEAGDLIRSQFSGMGRYGSGANNKVLGETISDMLLGGLENDWNRERGYQFSATQTGLDRAMAAAQGMLGAANAPLQAGQMLDAKAQQQIADEVQKFYALDNQDWNRLGMLQSAAAGAAGNYGITNATQRSSPGIGGILSGIGGLKPPTGG